MESVETTQKDSEHHHNDLRDLLEQTQNTLQQLNHIITAVLRRRPHPSSGIDEDSSDKPTDDSHDRNENDGDHGRETDEDMIVRGRSVAFQDAPVPPVGRGKTKHRTPVNASTFVGVTTTPTDAPSVLVPSVPPTSSLPFHSFGKPQPAKNVRKLIVTKRPQSAGRGFIPASMMMANTVSGRKGAAPGRLADILKGFHNQQEERQPASDLALPGTEKGELSKTPAEASQLLQDDVKFHDVEASVANGIVSINEGKEKNDAFSTICNVRSGGRGFIPFSKTAMDTLMKPPAFSKKQPIKPDIGLEQSAPFSTGQMQSRGLEKINDRDVPDLTASTEWMNRDDDIEDWDSKQTQGPGPDSSYRETRLNEPKEIPIESKMPVSGTPILDLGSAEWMNSSEDDEDWANEPKEIPIESKLPVSGSPVLDLGSAEWMNSSEDDEDWARDMDTERKHTQVSARSTVEEEENHHIDHSTEMRNEEQVPQPVAAAAMVWDPESCRWVGNEEDMADFDFSDSEVEEDVQTPVAGTTKAGSATSSSWSIDEVDTSARGDEGFEVGTSQPVVRKAEGKRDWERSDETIKSSAPLKKAERKLSESNKKKKAEFETSFSDDDDDDEEPDSPDAQINRRVSSSVQSRTPTEQESTFHISKEFHEYLFLCEQAHNQAMLIWLSFIHDQENDVAAVDIVPISESRKWAKAELQTTAV